MDTRLAQKPKRKLIPGRSTNILLTAYCVLFGYLQIGAPVCYAQVPEVDSVREYNVKSVYLYSFGRFIEWPVEAFKHSNGNFVIGVLGDDPFESRLNRIARKKRIRGRRIVVRRFRTLDDYQPCQILFVPRSASVELQVAAIKRFRERHVLVVGETPGFAAAGGTVNFVISEQSVRFEVNVRVAQRQQLAIGAKLLKLALPIRDARLSRESSLQNTSDQYRVR